MMISIAHATRRRATAFSYGQASPLARNDASCRCSRRHCIASGFTRFRFCCMRYVYPRPPPIPGVQASNLSIPIHLSVAFVARWLADIRSSKAAARSSLSMAIAPMCWRKEDGRGFCLFHASSKRHCSARGATRKTTLGTTMRQIEPVEASRSAVRRNRDPRRSLNRQHIAKRGHSLSARGHRGIHLNKYFHAPGPSFMLSPGMRRSESALT